MHKDVIDAVYSFQLMDLLERVQRGEEVTANEVAETLVCGLQSTHNSFVDMAKTCREYADIILRMQKEHSRERRIVQLFLSNNGLEQAYDNFEARILERIYDLKG
ncbi:MAG: hypothetical protein K0Q73_8808 [Paenibacillus sp.]|jgi:hypothetical protein|nr:hypothetical protein [Paenibacillus sp.]